MEIRDYLAIFTVIVQIVLVASVIISNKIQIVHVKEQLKELKELFTQQQRDHADLRVKVGA